MTDSTAPAAGPPIGDVGRASRFSLPDGRELWRLPIGADALMQRLLRLGAAGITGFVAAGVDAQGPWLVRALPARTLADRFADADGPWPWRTARDVAVAIAEALSVCEQKSIVPGPLRPDAVAITGETTAMLAADGLVRGLLGEQTGVDTAPSRYWPPAQAAGAPWDAAANRYVLGLLLYRMLAGEHPFARKGLRLAMADQIGRGAPPIRPEVAESLPPGLQSLTLQLLDPDPTVRPPSAAAVGQRLRAVVEVARRPRTAALAQAAPDPATPDPATALPTRRATRLRLPSAATWGVLPVLLGIGLAAAAAKRAPEPPKPAGATVGPRPSLGPATADPDDCMACHPHQTEQWHRSVMAHSVKSPLFGALEMLIEEQVGRDDDCPGGAGILRPADPATACRDRQTGLPITGSGGELWCVNCHAAGENLKRAVPAWDGRRTLSRSRDPLADLLPASTMEGITCAVCHQTHGPVTPGNERRGRYEGNPGWTSFLTGLRYEMRPEDRRGRFGIANSGYFLDPASFFTPRAGSAREVAGGVHLRPSVDTKAYLRSSEFCGACHDVRLFGTDVIGARQGEHFKRLRNAYSEWVTWAQSERRAGRQAASCQDCHMSEFPGICVRGEPSTVLQASFGATVPSALLRACPPGTHFEARRPGSRPTGPVATGSGAEGPLTTHYFSGVDVPLTAAFDRSLIDDETLDEAGIPRGAKQRRDLLLGATFRFALDGPARVGRGLSIPIEIENVGAGHRVPAGFSQEREIWVHLRVTDARGRVVYEVGRVDDDAEDLRDKIFTRINVGDRIRDGQGRPLGMFGADIVDGPDEPRWSPDPRRGGTRFAGRGLINLQNGFLRCVRCIGFIDGAGRCQPGPGQGSTRADRYADGDYDLDTGECRSNLLGDEALLETYFPVGALDATRGVLRGPDAIIDTRSAPPGVPLRYRYELATAGPGPFRVKARLLFRAFPPFLLRAFAAYEAQQAAIGRRPSGPLLTRDALRRLEVVELARATATIP